MNDQSYQSDLAASPDVLGKFVTYRALPCPLPGTWRDSLMAAKGIKEVDAVISRARATIGETVTRKFIFPVVRPV